MNCEENTTEQPRGLPVASAARYIGLSESFLNKARVNQTKLPGPAFIRVGARILYLRESLDRYLDNPPSL